MSCRLNLTHAASSQQPRVACWLVANGVERTLVGYLTVAVRAAGRHNPLPFFVKVRHLRPAVEVDGTHVVRPGFIALKTETYHTCAKIHHALCARCRLLVPFIAATYLWCNSKTLTAMKSGACWWPMSLPGTPWSPPTKTFRR